MELPIITYKYDDKTFDFISGKGEVLAILEEGQWKDFDGSWDDLWSELTEQYSQNEH